MDHEHSFLGRGWSFPPEFDETISSVTMVSADQDIKESLWIILSTIPGERLMVPDFGCGLHKMVYESLDISTITYMKDLIATAILYFEARITVNDIQVSTPDIVDGVIYIRIDYTIRAINARSNMVYPFYINEGTNLRADQKTLE